MQLEIPESVYNSLGLDSSYYYYNGNNTISSETGFVIELNRDDIEEILKHNNSFLSKGSQVDKLEKDFILYKFINKNEGKAA